MQRVFSRAEAAPSCEAQPLRFNGPESIAKGLVVAQPPQEAASLRTCLRNPMFECRNETRAQVGVALCGDHIDRVFEVGRRCPSPNNDATLIREAEPRILVP